MKKSILCEGSFFVIQNFDFIPNYANKFLVAACDSGIAIFDFETNQLLQKIPQLYNFLCDDICFIGCNDMKLKQNEVILLTKGQSGKEINQTSCHLSVLTIPTRGTGEFKLKEKNTYFHAQ